MLTFAYRIISLQFILLGCISFAYPLTDSTSSPISEPLSSNSIHPLRASIVGVGMVGGFIALDHGLRNNWWKDERVGFHFAEDFRYALNLDKVGHFYATSLGIFIVARSLEWTGVERMSAVWYGAAIGLFFEMYIEYNDGFSPRWGFDRVDAATNLLGAGFFVGRHYSSFLQNFDLKFSYRPSPQLGQMGSHGIADKPQSFIDDFEGHTYWLSVKVNRLLPERIERYWPDFLAVAMGMSVANLSSPGRRDQEFFLGLDYDFTALPGRGWIWQTLKETANYFRFPAPAVRIAPGVVWYGVYF